MKCRSKQLDIDDAQAGMILVEPICDMHGGVLLPQDTVLTEASLTSLRRRGIDHIVIIDNDISEEELLAEQKRLCDRLERLFRRVEPDGAAAAIRQAIMNYRLGSGL